MDHRVGQAGLADPEPDQRYRIQHVYLPPLRDAQGELDSARGTRLRDMFRAAASSDQLDAFEVEANAALSQLAGHEAARAVLKQVRPHLKSLTAPVDGRVVDLRHERRGLAALLRSLRLHMAAHGFEPSSLGSSGLGYANVLFVATVVLELIRAQHADLMLLLVEEPEAHLHPQLQYVMLDYLHDQAKKSAQSEAEDHRPQGRIQVIATTHSPLLASAVSTSNIVLVRSRSPHSVVQAEGRANAQGEPTGQTGQTSAATGSIGDGAGMAVATDDAATELPRDYPVTIARSLGAAELSDFERRKVDRYLDTTRASLLFARRVLLVEGIAEALLIRSLGKHFIYRATPDASEAETDRLGQLRGRFAGITLIPVGGVDFVPFLRLLLPTGADPLPERVAVVTDGDDGLGDERRSTMEQEFEGHVRAGVLSVSVCDTTLEGELFAAESNETLLRTAYLAQHPRSARKWDEVGEGAISEKDRARRFAQALRPGGLDLRKGEFAHLVSELIAQLTPSQSFTVPSHLLRAVRHLTEEPELVGDERSGER